MPGAARGWTISRMTLTRTRRTLIPLVAAVTVSVALAGCGGSERAATSTADAVGAIQLYDRGLADLVARAAPSVARIRVETLGGPVVGTGIVVDSGGLVLTNEHVVRDARSISVTVAVRGPRPRGATPVGRRAGSARFVRIRGAVVAHAPVLDLAIVKVPASGLVPIRLGSSAGLRPGQTVLSIGYALALPGAPSVTSGVVSALGRRVRMDDGRVFKGLIQTDAAINEGDSGGPLLDMSGRVVGINAISAYAQDVGFAIAVDQARALLTRAEAGGAA
jgi:S1-C subfamily serine protease